MDTIGAPSNGEGAGANGHGGEVESAGSRPTTPPAQFTEPTEFSLEEAIAYLPTGRFHAKLLVGTGMFMISTSLQFSILSFLAFIIQCQLPDWEVTDHSAALLSTLVFFGMLVGTFLWGFLSDIYGRKPIMLIVAATSCAFSLLRAASQDYKAMLALQFFLGASLSGFGVAFTYFLEFFPSRSRATWGMLLTVFWTLGMILGSLVSWVTESSGFRVVCVVASIPSLINVAAMALLPRSPQFLVAKNRLAEARDVLADAGIMNRKPFPPGFVLVNRTSKGVSARGSILASLGPRYRRTTLLLYLIWFGLGFIYYGVMMMSSNIQDARLLMIQYERTRAGQPRLNATEDDSFCPPDGSRVFSTSDYISSLVISVAELPGIAIAWIFVDRAGRRATQTTACLICAAAMFILGLLPPTLPNLDVFLLFVARGLSNTGYSVTWIYTPEVFPPSFRTTAFAVSECFSHIGSMLTPFVGQTMLANALLPESAMIYCAASLLTALASCSLKVETAGKEFAVDEDDIVRQFSSARFGDVELQSPPGTTALSPPPPGTSPPLLHSTSRSVQVI